MNGLQKIFSRLVRFAAGILRTGSPESSKRAMGITMIIWVHVLMSLRIEHPMMETSLYLGAALLGLETIRDVFKKNGT